MQQKFERKLQQPMKRLLNSHVKQVTEIISVAGRDFDIDVVLMDAEQQISSLLIDKNRVNGLAHAAFTERLIIKSLPAERKQFDVFQSFYDNWLRTEGLKWGTSINKTTKKKIIKILRDHPDEGEVALAELIETKVKSLNIFRARTIARTETHNAANHASQLMAENTGFAEETVKEWLTSLDGNERDTHGDADGQTIKLNEMFQVGGAQLMRPGDTAGLGDVTPEIINCRCTSAFSIDTV